MIQIQDLSDQPILNRISSESKPGSCKIRSAMILSCPLGAIASIVDAVDTADRSLVIGSGMKQSGILNSGDR